MSGNLQKIFIGLLVASVGTTSCMDSSYDLGQDIDLSISVGGDSFVIPLGYTQLTRLDSLIDTTESFKLDDEGRYSISKEDNIDDTNVDVESVDIDIEDPQIDPVRVEFGENTKIDPFTIDISPENISVNIEDVTVNPTMPHISGLKDEQTLQSASGSATVDLIFNLKSEQSISLKMNDSDFKDVNTLHSVYFGSNGNGELIEFDINTSALNLEPGSINKINSFIVTFPEGFKLKTNGLGRVEDNRFILQNSSVNKVSLYVVGVEHEFSISNKEYAGNISFDLQYSVNGELKAGSTTSKLSAGMPDTELEFGYAEVTTKNIDAPFESGEIAVSATLSGMEDVNEVKNVTFEDGSVLTFNISKMASLPLNFTSDSKVKIVLPQIMNLQPKTLSGGATYNNGELLIPASNLIGNGIYKVDFVLNSIDFTKQPGSGKVQADGTLKLNQKVSYYPISSKSGQLILAGGKVNTSNLKNLSRNVNIETKCETNNSGELLVESSLVDANVVSSEVSSNADFEINESNVAKELKSLKNVYWADGKSVPMTMKIDFSQLPADIKNGIKFDGLTITLPKFIEFEETDGTNELNKETNTLVINRTFVPNASNNRTFTKELYIKGMNFKEIYGENGLEVVDRTLIVDKKYTKVSIEGVVKTNSNETINTSDLEAFEIQPSLSIGKMTVGKIIGKVEPEIDPVNERVDLDLGDDLDFITEEGNEMLLENPVITFTLDNPVGVPVNLDLNMAAYLEGNSTPINGSTVNISTTLYPNFKLQPALSDGTPVKTVFVISRKPAETTNPDTETLKHVYVTVENLSQLIKRVPDEIEFNMNASVDQSVDHVIDVTPNFVLNGDKIARFTITGDYKVAVPLEFESLNITYDDVVDGLKSDLGDITDKLTNAELEIKADIYSEIPVDLKLSVIPMDENENQLDGIHTIIKINDKEDGYIVGTTVEGESVDNKLSVTLIADDNEQIKKLDKLKIKVNAITNQTNNGVPLRGDQKLMISEMRVYVKRADLDLN